MSVEATTPRRQQGWARFADRAEALGATFFRAPSTSDAATVLASAGEHLVVTESLAQAYPALAANHPRAGGPPTAERAAPSGEVAVAASEVVVPAAEVAALGRFAVAETGSVALDEPRLDRGACFLADRLWLIVPEDALVDTLDEALNQIRQLVERGAHHPLLMSGPSRTADIERVLTIGVHGPRALSLIILSAA